MAKGGPCGAAFPFGGMPRMETLLVAGLPRGGPPVRAAV